MNNVATSNSPRIGALYTSLLVLAMLAALVFVFAAALPYLVPGSEVLTAFAGREFWIITHIIGGTVAILIGPAQIWMGLKRKALAWHKRLGFAYLASIAISVVASFYLAVTTRNGWMFGMGLFGLGVAWVVTTGLAFVAIKKHDYLQHQEWMIRSYVVTLGFVFFRVFVVVSSILGVGEIGERLTAASWFCWAFPLLITEAVIQGRKIFATS